MSDIAYDTIKECINTLTEDEAFQVFHDLREKFGWAGTFFTRGDAEVEWQNLQHDDSTGETSNAPMPDEVWEAVQNTWGWRKGIIDRLTEDGWQHVAHAVSEAIN